MSIGWLPDGTEESLRSALAIGAQELAALPIKIDPRHVASDPRWWSTSAIVDGRFVVKFAWSEIRARLLWRKGVVLERLGTHEPSLPVPELVALSREPALVVTRLVPGVPLSWEWASSLSELETAEVGGQIAGFLGRLHGAEVADVVGISHQSIRRRRRTPKVSVVAFHASSTLAEERR